MAYPNCQVLIAKLGAAKEENAQLQASLDAYREVLETGDVAELVRAARRYLVDARFRLSDAEASLSDIRVFLKRAGELFGPDGELKGDHV